VGTGARATKTRDYSLADMRYEWGCRWRPWPVESNREPDDRAWTGVSKATYHVYSLC